MAPHNAAQAPPANADETLVRDYLAAMEARDLEKARGMLAPGFAMVFPGGAVFEQLEALLSWSQPRYRFVRKRIDRIERAGQVGAISVVFCMGGLSGEWPDGTPFSGIRFIDRFELVDGRLTRQEVWNDMAEHRGSA
ncbi:MAG: nuclear transport factor 2 family protein [Pseudomonadota bacterium]